MKAFSRPSSGPPQLMQRTFASTGAEASTFTSAYFAVQWGHWNGFERNFSVMEREPNCDQSCPRSRCPDANLLRPNRSCTALAMPHVVMPPSGVHMARALTLALLLQFSMPSAFAQYVTEILPGRATAAQCSRRMY